MIFRAFPFVVCCASQTNLQEAGAKWCCFDIDLASFRGIIIAWAPEAKNRNRLPPSRLRALKMSARFNASKSLFDRLPGRVRRHGSLSSNRSNLSPR
jgi:hypothetical protein